MITVLIRDSLDEPLHLQILTSLASSLARHPPKTDHAGDGSRVPTDDHLGIILKGLPCDDTIAEDGVELGTGSEDGDVDNEWVGLGLCASAALKGIRW